MTVTACTPVAFTSATSVTITDTVGVNDGDVLVLVLQSAEAAFTMSSYPDAGWGGEISVSGGGQLGLMARKLTASSEGSSWTFNFGGTQNGIATVIVITDTDNQEHGTASMSQSGNGSSHTTPSITPDVDGCTIISLFGSDDGQTMTWSGGSGTLLISQPAEETSTWTSIAAWVEVQATAGAYTNTATSDNNCVSNNGVMAFGPAGGTQYQQTAGGAVTTVGDAVPRAGKLALGSVTSSGILSKESSKSFVGALTAIGTVTKEASKAFLGSMTASGVLNAFKLVFQTVGGALTALGILSKSTNKGTSGVSTSVGTVTKQSSKSFTGAVTTSGVLNRAATYVRSFIGSITASGALSTIKTKLLSIAGSLTPSGILSRSTYKITEGSVTALGVLSTVVAYVRSLVGNVVASGTLTKQVSKAFSGVVTAAGLLGTVFTPGGLQQIVGGVLTAVGILTKSTDKQVSGTTVATGTLTRLISKTFAGIIQSVGSLVTQFVSALLGPTPSRRTYAINAQDRVFAICDNDRTFAINKSERAYAIGG